jgi:acetyl esterase/lipase
MPEGRRPRASARPTLVGKRNLTENGLELQTAYSMVIRTVWVVLLSACLLAADRKAGAEKWAENYNIPLWEEGKVPLAKGNGPLDSPFLTVFMPPEEKRNGTSVVIAPGGANIMLMYGGEGLEIAERFNDWGAAAFVLTYRLSPRYGANERVMDGKRAIQLVRSRAGEWKLNPDRIGLAGFSAGSNLGRSVAAAAGAGDPNATDPVDRVSSRPDFLVLVYGAGRAAEGEQLKDFPPTFLLSAAADRGAANPSAQLFMDLNRAGATAEIHIYQKGRHGFGAAFGSPEFSPWMPALQHFLRQGGLLPEGK